MQRDLLRRALIDLETLMSEFVDDQSHPVSETIRDIKTALAIPDPQADLKERLNCLYTDFSMLRSGDWVPDSDSSEASLDMVVAISRQLQTVGVLPARFEPRDTRCQHDDSTPCVCCRSCSQCRDDLDTEGCCVDCGGAGKGIEPYK